MNILVDANVLLRLADPSSTAHAAAFKAISELRLQGNVLYIVPQCIYEFWAVATRPRAKNGLGLSVSECMREVINLKAMFSFLNDKPSLFAEWETIVSTSACHGKVAHDARYAAAMRTYGTTNLLTFNVGDFSRFSWLTAVDPNTVSPTRPPSKIP